VSRRPGSNGQTRIYASPPIVVEDALRGVGIAWTAADGREGTFTAQRCPLGCDGGLRMQWLGDRFVFKCADGHRHDESLAALGIAPGADDGRYAPLDPLEPPGGPAATQGTILPPPTEPVAVARELAARRYQLDDGTPTLRHWRGGWWEWRGSHWAELEHRVVRAAAYAFTEHAVYAKGDDLEPWSPNRNKIANLLEALAAVVHG
jgi:hypothetical protein